MLLPRVKRQFVSADENSSQRRITSYFDKVQQGGPNNNVGATDSTTSAVTASFPELPPSVQSNLLNAAMRVRKSVSEGRKSANSLSWGWNWGDEQKHDSDWAPSVALPPSSHLTNGGAVRELEPFSGIHRIGGYMAQPVPPTRHGSGSGVTMDLDMGGQRTSSNFMADLVSSQESATSTQSITSSGLDMEDVTVTAVFPYLKRSREDSDDEEEGGEENENHDDTSKTIGRLGLHRRVPRPVLRGRRPGRNNSGYAIHAFQDFDPMEASFLDPSNHEPRTDEMIE